LLRRLEFLGDRNAFNFADGAESVVAVSIVVRNNGGNACAVSVLARERRSSVITSGQPRGFDRLETKQSPKDVQIALGWNDEDVNILSASLGRGGSETRPIA
jgi:hypothetical protein